MAIQKRDRKRAKAVMRQFEADEAERVRQRNLRKLADAIQPWSVPPVIVDTVNN